MKLPCSASLTHWRMLGSVDAPNSRLLFAWRQPAVASPGRGILESHGFEVASVACKHGGIPKEELGIKDDEKIRPGNYEAICNPVGQAELLKRAGCELNVVLGLCVGHDSLFFKHARGLTTVLVQRSGAGGTTLSAPSTWPTPITAGCGDQIGRRSRRKSPSRAVARTRRRDPEAAGFSAIICYRRASRISRRGRHCDGVGHPHAWIGLSKSLPCHFHISNSDAFSPSEEKR